MKQQLSRLLTIVGSLFILLNHLSFSQTDTIKVALDIGTDSRVSIKIEQRLRSFIERELRSLNDVEIVEEDENLRLRIQCINNKSGGFVYGFTLGVISLQLIDCNNLLIYSFVNSTMITTNEDRLSNTAQNIVAWFNHDSLDLIRKSNSGENLEN